MVPKNTNGPAYAEPSSYSVVREHSVQTQYWSGVLLVSSYLRRLSLRFLLNEILHHKPENGPDGTRTRICDLDRVLCSHCTTGPITSLKNLMTHPQGRESQRFRDVSKSGKEVG